MARANLPSSVALRIPWFFTISCRKAVPCYIYIYCCHPLVLTSLRPDIFLFSLSAKRAVILELTCPNEDRFEISKKLKEDRYINLQKQIIANGFDCNIYTIEVGVRGNIALDQLEAIGRVEVFTIFHFATRKFTIFHLIFCCFLVVIMCENV